MTSRLSLSQIAKSARTIDPVFRSSPQFESEPISQLLGSRIVLKIETINPIRSFKGRGADFFLSEFKDDARQLVCASAGNFGQGLAYAARKRGRQLVVYAAEGANPLKVSRMRELGAHVVLEGKDFDEAKVAARKFARDGGGRFVEDGREVAISEGAGSIAVELLKWPNRFDAVLVPLGNGGLLSGVGLWLKAAAPQTKVIGVCASGAPCMALSWRAKAIRETASASTIADGISIRIPVAEALSDLEDLVDDIVLIEDGYMVEATRAIFQHHGIATEPSGVAGLAAAIAHRGCFRNESIATVICGGNLEATFVSQWLLEREVAHVGVGSERA